MDITTLRFTSSLGKMVHLLKEHGIELPTEQEELRRETNRLQSKILRQQEEIETSKKRIWQAFHCSHIAQVITGVFGDIKEVNQRFCELLGYSQTELIGKPLASITKTGDTFTDNNFHEVVKEALEKQGANDTIPTWEKVFIKKDGTEIITFVSVFPIRQDWHNVQYFVGRDVRPKCFAPENEQCMYIEKAKRENGLK